MNSYRYPGPRPFEENDINLFFGRDKDKKNLLTFISVEQMLVVFSKSGLGKSSLINAAIIPELRKKNYEIILCRFNSYVGKEINENIDAELSTPLQKLFNEVAANQSANKQTATTFLDNLKHNDNFSLWHQFKNLQINSRGKKTCFIFFDQFEELFTYPKEQVKDFKEHLAELLSTAVPQEYLDKINQVENDDSSADLTNEELSLLYDPVPVKMLCTIRSDKFSLLTNLKDAIPGIVTKTYELKPFSESEATEAIRKPAYIEVNPGDDGFISDTFNYDDDAITKMLSYLSDNRTEDIESFQLQILCRYVEDIVVESKNNGNPIKNITANQLGDIKNVFEAYYNKLIAGIDKDKIQNVKKLFEDGLIFEKDKIRVSLYEGQIESYGVDEVLLNKLVGTHLIRCEPDTNGKEKYELSHDSLIDPILKAREKRIEEEKVTLQKKKLKKRVEIFGGIGVGIFLIFAVLLYIFSRNTKKDHMLIDFLTKEKDWVYLLDASQRNEIMSPNFLFLANRDSAKYNALKYSFKCAGYANKYAVSNYQLALKYAQEGFLKDSNWVIKKSFDSLINKPNIYLPSAKEIVTSGAINNVRITNDRQEIIAATKNGIFWYNATTGKAIDSLTTDQNQSDISVFSKNADYLLYQKYDEYLNTNTTYLLNLATKVRTTIDSGYNNGINNYMGLDIAPNNKFFVHTAGKKTVAVNSLNGSLIKKYTFPLEEYDFINKLRISPDNSYIVACTSTGQVFLLNMQSVLSKNNPLLLADTIRKNSLHTETVNSVSFSNDGRFILTGSSDGKVCVWDMNNNNIYAIIDNGSPVSRCRFSDDGKYILIGNAKSSTITKWATKQSNAAIDPTGKTVNKSDTAVYKSETLQLLGLDSTITSLHFYNSDSNIIASSNNQIVVWNLSSKKNNRLTINSLVMEGIVPRFNLTDRLKLNLLTLQDLLTQTRTKSEVMEGMKVIDDSLIDIDYNDDSNLNQKVIDDLTDLSISLYNRIKNLKGNLSKSDSCNLFLYAGDNYYYKMPSNKNNKNVRFNSVYLNNLIHFAQMRLGVDTLQSEAFTELFNAYIIPISYYFTNNQYDSANFWNDKILQDNPELMQADTLRKGIMIVHQYDVSFKLLNNDVAGAKNSLDKWSDTANVNYILSKELFFIVTNANYHFDKKRLENALLNYDLLNDQYARQSIGDMQSVTELIKEGKSKNHKFTNTIMNNLTSFSNFTYSYINK